MKTRTETVVDVQEWDKLVTDTYERPYSFQQQDGCKPRGVVRITVPQEDAEDYDCENDTVPEEVNHEEQGVSFKAWLERDPKQLLPSESKGQTWETEMWWDRNFYPDVNMIANDLHKKGLLEAGEYSINIDW